MSIPQARRMNLIALALLITALIACVAFHFLPTISGEEIDRGEYDPNDFKGWTIWEEIGNFAKSPNIGDFQEMIGVSTFLTGVLLILSSPFLIPVLRRSRLVWWIATIASGLVLTGLGGLLVISNLEPDDQPGPAIYCLLVSLALNFLGLLFIRRELPAAPLPAAFP
jgi:hypothetical protein